MAEARVAQEGAATTRVLQPSRVDHSHQTSRPALPAIQTLPRRPLLGLPPHRRLALRLPATETLALISAAFSFARHCIMDILVLIRWTVFASELLNLVLHLY